MRGQTPRDGFLVGMDGVQLPSPLDDVAYPTRRRLRPALGEQIRRLCAWARKAAEPPHVFDKGQVAHRAKANALKVPTKRSACFQP